MRSFRTSPQFDGFSRVVIIVSDEIEYTAGTDSGRTLRLTCPWGTPEMAQNILESVRGFQYQPYEAQGAILDPAAELGDGVTANNVYGGIYTKKIKFGSLMTATVAAPEDEEINHEYPYKSKPNKEITREAKMLRASLKIEADRITQEVTDRTNAVEDLTSQLKIQAGQIAAKVSKTGGDPSSFGWTLTDSDWTISGDGREILKATKDGLDVYGEITATGGEIGGFYIARDHLSYNNQTWGGTNTIGIYLGPSGFQLGKNFRVDNSGNLTAASGTFTGTVHAGNIAYGEKEGYFNGGGISSGTISGNRLVANTVTTAYTSDGINGSLGRADTAYNIATGYSRFGTLVGSTLSADDIKLGKLSRTLGTTQITYKDGSDKTKTLNVVIWS
jgi:hypothetical protein